MYIFQALNIYKKYTNHLALDDVSINVPKGSICGLLGPNGAGKTTLLRIANQIMAADKGSLYYQERKLHQNDIYRIGYMPEERGLYRKMKTGEHAIYLAQLKGLSKKEAATKLKYWFEKFDLLAWWDKKVEELSKGMQQKVQFIITVLHEPELLIFDEPFTGFDPINMNLLKEEILHLRNNGATIIFSTHNMGSVEELCDHITLINKAKTIIEGPIEKIREKYKSNVFEVSFKGDEMKIGKNLNPNYELLDLTGKGDIQFAQIKICKEGSGNELLSTLLPLVDIVSFNEVVPGMNDIFIEIVEQSNRPEN